VTNHPDSPTIRFVALGGLGEIGLNCLSIEADGKIVVVDCGVSFPHSDLGIDVFHPDFSYLEARRERIVGILITHGHEDHIGALPYLLRIVDTPVYGPCHALGLASERLGERHFDLRQLRLRPIQPGNNYQVGPFAVEPVRVSHSITDACALVLRHRSYTIVHTGDFKFDSELPEGQATDEQRLREVGEEGVDLMLSDSTNIDTAGSSGSERSVGRALSDAVGSCENRVIIGMFSSNVHRLRMVGDIAREHGRKITLLGRSVQTQVRVATKCGNLDWPSDLLVSHDAVGSLARRQSLIIASGTQAEPMAALSRLSVRNHPALALAPDDLLIMSSRIIPGNDPPVFRMMGNFIRQRVRVENRITNPALHVSGHAHRDEQRRMIELLRPKHFMPIHGTLHHLNRHAQFARSLGVANVMLAENGDVVEFGDAGLKKTGVTEVGKVATFNGDEIPKEVLKQREILGRQGIAVVTLSVNSRGRLLSPPMLNTRGVLDDSEESDVLHGAAENVAKILSGWNFTSEYPTDQQIVDVAERALQRNLDGISSRRPMTLVHVVRP
jgi:ribonuclease J